MFCYFLFLIFLTQLIFTSGDYTGPGPLTNVASRRPIGRRLESLTEHGNTDVYEDVSISYKNRPICSGILVSKYHVVTAADCISSRYIGDLSVTVHSPSLLSANSTYKTGVEKVFIHPRFDGLARNNIGVLKVEDKLPEGLEVAIVSNKELTSQCTWEAWRSIRKGDLRLDLDILENKRMSQKDKSECKEAARGFKNMPQDFICVKANFVKHYCPFRKGMGLTCEGKLNGICTVATCSRKALSLMYLDVSQYRIWIKNVIRDIYQPIESKRVRRDDDEGEEGGGENVSDDESAAATEPADGSKGDGPDVNVLVVPAGVAQPMPCFITNADAPAFPNYYGFDPREEDYDLMDYSMGFSLQKNVFPGIFGALIGCFLFKLF